MENLPVEIIDNLENATLLKNSEVVGLIQIKQHIEEYLAADSSNENSNVELRLYLEKVNVDDSLLIKYLRGRKYNPFIAWDTIRRYVENRFVFYPEIFVEDIADEVRNLITGHALGILKNCDKLGRRIVFFNIKKWDANKVTLDDLTAAGVLGCEKFWKDPAVMKNGIIIIENTQGFSTAHAKQHTISKLIRMRNVFMYSFPISIKGLYYINVPMVFNLIVKMSKHLAPQKIAKRTFLYTTNQSPKELFDVAPREILPQWVGGTLSDEDAAEPWSFFADKLN